MPVPAQGTVDFVNICVLIGDVQGGEVAYRRFAAIIDLAIKHANDLLLPPNITLRKFYLPENPRRSGPCISSCGAARALDLLHTGANCHVFLGPDTPNSINNLYGVAYAYDIPILSTAEYGISHRPESSLLTLPFFHVADLIQVIIKFLKFRGYSYVATFEDQSDQLFAAYGDEFYDAYKRSFNITADGNRIRLTTTQFRRNETSDDELRAYLAYASTRARTFVVFTFFDSFKRLLQWFTIHPYEDLFYGSTDLRNFQRGSEQREILRILQGHIGVISLKLTRQLAFSDFEDIVRLQAKQFYDYYFAPTLRIDALVTAHYDMVILFAEAVRQLQKAGRNFREGSLLSRYMRNTTYTGLQSGKVRIDTNGDAKLSYEIMGVTTGATEFTPLWEYDAVTDKFHLVRELADFPVLDVPVCGFTGDAPICQEHQRLSTTVIVLAVVLPAIIVIILAVGLFARALRRLKLQLNPNWWKIKQEELRYTHKRTRTYNGSSPFNSSDISPKYQRSLNYGLNYSTATYRGYDVLVQDLSNLGLHLTPFIARQIGMLRHIAHDNVQKFFGAHLDQNDLFLALVTELCSKGDLTTLLENRSIQLDWTIKSSFVKDLVQGMAYINTTNVHSHGNLTSHSVMVDGKFTLKVCGFGHSYLRTAEELAPVDVTDTDRNYDLLLWRAPEFLSINMPPSGTPRGDVYSFAIILQQIILESRPFSNHNEKRDKYSALEIINEVLQSNVPPTRPQVSRSACPNAVYELMEQCWSEFPLDRPSFQKIRDQLKRILGNFQDNIVEQLLDRMDQYAKDLELQVAEKTMQFVDEKRRSDDLLSQILPSSVAAALIKGQAVEPESYSGVTIYFSDIVGFTTISSELTPLQVIFFLNSLYTTFDQILELYDVYKVETIGDAYMVVSGLPIRNGNRHAAEMSSVAIHLRNEILKFDVSQMTERRVELRIGLNTGPCVAGVVGLKMPRYCLFGDTVNLASRMESTGEPMKIQVTHTTKALLDACGGFSVTERGNIEIKGKGLVMTYWLLGKTASRAVSESGKTLSASWISPSEDSVEL
ncbi:Atrial natriuretic peptide receptor 1 [Hypsibius exemplaris]|uniref:Guanylate cyclase n=1 Tax=Hypsibius exemplaris TaxID=2072580 RepID=A0A9X6NDM4_HYPEX|nr:Atrial natriuretic peptide receptor 1 [Hypsibius exemplaris]